MGVRERLMAAAHALMGGSSQPTIDQTGRYALLWAFYAGTWRSDPGVVAQRAKDPRVYKNTRLVWSLARSVTRLYANNVYAGDLSTDGQPLPDGTRGAIPIEARTGNKSADDKLMLACAELWNMWNWRQHMATRPKMTAILGDSLTELVEDVERARLVPRTVWPGYVRDLEIDIAGNVKRYAIEHRVVVPESRSFGVVVKAESYDYRKEVDGKWFRFYKDGEPFAYDGKPSAYENPFGFAPAIWDVHEQGWGNSGLGAFEPALQAIMEINSVLSHAMDYQRKQFSAPVGVRGGNLAGLGRSGSRSVTMPGAGQILLPSPATAALDPARADAEALADSMGLMPMEQGGGFESVQMDIGKTGELITMLSDSLASEYPESSFAKELLEMTQLTAPGAERALGTVVSLIRAARNNADPNTVKLKQMAITMLGERLKANEYPEDRLTKRHEAFKDYSLDSFKEGMLDFGIADREVIPETIDERIDRLIKIEKLTDEWSMKQAGVPDEVIQERLAARQAEQEAMAEAVTGVPAGQSAGGARRGATKPAGRQVPKAAPGGIPKPAKAKAPGAVR